MFLRRRVFLMFLILTSVLNPPSLSTHLPGVHFVKVKSLLLWYGIRSITVYLLYYIKSFKNLDMLKLRIVLDTWKVILLNSYSQVVNIVYKVWLRFIILSLLTYIHSPIPHVPLRDMKHKLKRHLDFEEILYFE